MAGGPGANAAILAAQQQSSSTQGQTRSLASLLNEFLTTSRTVNERSQNAQSHRPSFDSQK